MGLFFFSKNNLKFVLRKIKKEIEIVYEFDAYRGLGEVSPDYSG